LKKKSQKAKKNRVCNQNASQKSGSIKK